MAAVRRGVVLDPNRREGTPLPGAAGAVERVQAPVARTGPAAEAQNASQSAAAASAVVSVVKDAWSMLVNSSRGAVADLRARWGINGAVEDARLSDIAKATSQLLTEDETANLPGDPELFELGHIVATRLRQGIRPPRFEAVDAAGAIAPWISAADVTWLWQRSAENDPTGMRQLSTEWGYDWATNIRIGCCAIRATLLHEEIGMLTLNAPIWRSAASIGRRMLYAPEDGPQSAEGDETMAEDTKALDEEIKRLQREKMNARAEGDHDLFHDLDRQQTRVFRQRYPEDLGDPIVGSSGRTL